MSSQPFTIRSFQSADQTAARRLIMAGLAEHFGYADEYANPDLDDIAANYPARGHAFLVAESGGNLIGAAGLRLVGSEAGRVVRVSVARGHRGQGIARALMMRLHELAARMGLDRLWVETNDDWADAIGLYVALGYREYARADGSIYLALELAPCNPDGCVA
jgi:ribosomal protein S18 acetylase RimI-like enzyme